MTKIVILFLGLFQVVSSQAFANTFVGNGGDGVLRNGVLTLLEFVDHRVDPDQVPCHGDPRPLRALWPKDLNDLMNDQEVRCLATAFGRIEKKYPLIADFLRRIPTMYRWILLDGPLRRSNEESTYLDPGTYEPVTMANRHQNVVRISRAAWEPLSPANRAGLILHEIIYAAIQPTCDSVGFCQQLPLTARNLNGPLFLPEIYDIPSLNQWIQAIGGDQIDRGLGLNETFQPIFYDYPQSSMAAQQAVFYQRRCAGSPCENHPLDFVVRNLYVLLMMRSGADYEVYFWVHHASALHYRCQTLLDAFLNEKDFRNRTPDDQAGLVHEAWSKVMNSPFPQGRNAVDALRRHSEEWCKTLSKIEKVFERQ